MTAERPEVLRAREMGELLRAQRTTAEPYGFVRTTRYRPPPSPRPAVQPDGAAEAAAWLRDVHEQAIRESRGLDAVRDRIEAERTILAHVLGWEHDEDRPVYYAPCGPLEPGDECSCHLEWRQLAILGPLTSGWQRWPGWREDWSVEA